MDAQDLKIIDTFERLISDYSAERSCAFLKACWLLDEQATFRSDSLRRMIFSEGDTQEIYTLEERTFVAAFVPHVDYFYFQKTSARSAIDCRVISIDLGLSNDTIYDSIKFMKIFNKSFKGFNFFAFCCAEGIHIGCSCFKNSDSERDCLISPLITPHINWEILINTFLYRDESSSLYTHYLGILNTIYEIQRCFETPVDEQSAEAFPHLFEDDDPVDWLGRIRLSDCVEYLVDIGPTQKDVVLDAEVFETIVEESFLELDYIKTLRANPIEMLFDAEAALEQSTAINLQSAIRADFPSLAATAIDNENIALLEDPVTLVKKLKTKLATI